MNEHENSRGRETEALPWRELRDELGIGTTEAGRAAYDRTRRLYELGDEVRALRRKRGLTQTELAKLAATSQAAIARIEAAGPEPRLSTLERIGHALGVDLVVTFRKRKPLASP
jgi:ribosome-binding protein aMBF1 (putative translation factor)